MARRRRNESSVTVSETSEHTQIEGARDIVVMFADVVGCSEISNHKGIEEYNKFISRFQECFINVCEHYQKEEYKDNESFFDYQVRGDEGCLKIFVPGREDLSVDIDNAINIALDLKRKWLLGQDNKERIENGLLPVDIGIGIHSGKIIINPDGIDKEGKIKYRPEGYAINLAKRIESESRGGKFSHVLVSESARGQLHSLKDEFTYRFDDPFSIKPKGISRDIKVFEVKHHFLPTDWQDMPSEVSMIYKELDSEKVRVASGAYRINPMNLWLAEEYIQLSMMNDYKGKDSNKYQEALTVARDLAKGVLRDAGLLALLGFILGERGYYQEEQKLYKEAGDIDEQDGLIHWYYGLSLSYELDDSRKKSKEIVKSFYKTHIDDIEVIFKKYKRAIELLPVNVWIIYDYAGELAWWSKAEPKFRKKAIEMLIRAFSLNADTKKQAKGEPYLTPIIDDSEIKKFLD